MNTNTKITNIANTDNCVSGDLELLMRLIEKCIDDGREDEAGRIFEAAGEAPFVSGEEALRWGMVAEMLGRPDSAREAYNIAVNDSGSEPGALVKLGQMCLDRGDIKGGESFFNRAGQKGLHPEILNHIENEMQFITGVEPDFVPEPIHDVRLQQAVRQFMQLFRGRQHLYARQWYDHSKNLSGYAPIHDLLTPEVVKKHLSGAVTIGIYPMMEGNTVCFSALDIDIKKSCLSRMHDDSDFRKKIRRKIRDIIAETYRWSISRELRVIFEDSGQKGAHAWFFFEKALPAVFVIDLLNSCVASFTDVPEEIKIEVFPRQAVTGGKGYGNLIKVPLGVHRTTGRKSVFLDNTGREVKDQLEFLCCIKRNSGAVMEKQYELWEKANFKKKVAQIHSNTAPVNPVSLSLSEAVNELAGKCAMTGYLIKKAVEHRHLSFAERKILLGVFGHIENGKEMLHSILSRCSDYSSQITDHYISRLKGTPLGCRKIRRMLFYLEGSILCNCTFTTDQGEYPTPILHLRQDKNICTVTRKSDLVQEVNELKTEIAAIKKIVEGIAGGNRICC